MPTATGTLAEGSGDQSPTAPGLTTAAGGGDGSPTAPGLTKAAGAGDASPTSPGLTKAAGAGDASPTAPGLTKAAGAGDGSPTAPGLTTAEGAGNDPIGATAAYPMGNGGRGNVGARARLLSGQLNQGTPGVLKFVEGSDPEQWSSDGTGLPEFGFVLGYSSGLSAWALYYLYTAFPTALYWTAAGTAEDDPSDLTFVGQGGATGTPVISAEYTAPGLTTSAGSGDQSPSSPGAIIP